jgi:hypothetical protein
MAWYPIKHRNNLTFTMPIVLFTLYTLVAVAGIPVITGGKQVVKT